MSFINTFQTRFISTSSVLMRYASITPAVDFRAIPQPGRSKKAWQRTKHLGTGPMFRKLRRVQWCDSKTSDPDLAAKVSRVKLDSLQNSLQARGFARQRQPYNPAEDVEVKIRQIATNIFGEQAQNDDWKKIRLDDPILKFKFLDQCWKELNYEVENPSLHLMKRVGSVVRYYSEPVVGINSYDMMLTKVDDLPENLSVRPNYLSFDAELEFFDGLDAQPGVQIIETRLKAKMKYPNYKEDFPWPDV